MNVYCRDLGQMDYKACWDLQQTLFDALTAGKTNRTAAPESATPSSEEAGTILLVEHPPVYTLGKSGHAENLLVGREALEAMGAQFFHIDRGGDITFHGPGQLVCYPILDLERLGIGLRAYIDALEESVIRTVAEYGIRAERIAGASGVWVGAGIAQEGDHRTADGGGKCTPAGAPRKICAIGVRSSRYITMHGFALNVTTDLEWFSRINAYGAGRGIRILHYINSSGLKEIIEGTEIAHEFRRIYACSFLYDIDGVAYWPAVAVNYTNKTQFIFKINKGVESVFDSKLVNQYIEEDKRPVPFRRMIYVGDGTTDIPCMRLVKNSGGHSIAVYNPEIRNARRELNGLIRDNRVSHVCPADYSEGSEMDTLVKTIIDKIEADHRLELLETPRT